MSHSCALKEKLKNIESLSSTDANKLLDDAIDTLFEYPNHANIQYIYEAYDQLYLYRHWLKQNMVFLSRE